ncbi:von Willebrand factor A domain-containing protein 5B1 [Protopterus annectens]|uniref:von Willebrand factor A domain-containing protein 5B1 n=1 Tax=Protopterus annectens TaxID=7888 RepID=UPI001CF93CDB|nr:von Willebrand factor A domain-containing protein 5B1 [Protopterus annectens]
MESSMQKSKIQTKEIPTLSSSTTDAAPEGLDNGDDDDDDDDVGDDDVNDATSSSCYKSGLFVFPLDEYTTVVGFEAVVSGRVITVQIKDKAKTDDCYLDCCSLPNGGLQKENGRILLDEDLERVIFAVNVGIVPPSEKITVLISTSSELQTLPNGALRVFIPSVCVPRVQVSSTEENGQSITHQQKRGHHHCSYEQTASTNQFSIALLVEEETTNASEYDFSFRLEIRGPYLLAGVESPTHEIRADADPSAYSATSIMITLANRHTYDRPVEIIIHPSEPHMAHILMEYGDMTPDEYEQHLKGKSDFVKGTRKDPSSEKKVEIIKKRLSKDILHNPVVMLNFCPDLRGAQPELKKMHGEFIFLIDRSGSMSGININRVKDAMLVILKSLVPACLFNIIGFGSSFKTLFPSSQVYNEETLALACDYLKRIRADMGGTDIYSPLNWILRQPVSRGHPRLIFLLTDGAVSNTGKVIELVRNHSRSTRCYSFGIGQNACRRLVKGLAVVSKGTAEFLVEGERLQPKMVKSLKKAMAPSLTDIRIDWFFPETAEVLVSPVGASFLFPGDRLIGYSVVCDTSRYHTNPKSEKRHQYNMMHSQESGSSVFYHSQEEESNKTLSESRKSSKEVAVGSLRDSSQELSPDIAITEDVVGTNTKSPRRRAYSTNQIADHGPFKKSPTSSDPTSAAGKNPLRRAKAQDLVGQTSPEGLISFQVDYQASFKSVYLQTTCCV